MRKLKYIMILFLVLLFANAIYYHYSSGRAVNEIRRQINGIVIKKYDTGHARLVSIKQSDGTIIDFSQDNLYSYIREGDHFTKQANDNYCYVKRNGETKKFIFTYISPKTRNSFDWPKEWKNKWMEATEE
ncbi:hypothetical protein [Chryseobacterium sediminis]|uniref:hypothetical protein n=1 Tax=Chryseobacterium sediminis TaxID=1679494 RepID=UPI00286641AD|nr:hypothetical protein [Chryseobacterium sediminis]MDR6464573.1 hypothetical protein [Chryseobacterium sediminis]